MNIDSRYFVGHHFLLAGSGERAAITLTRVTGYRRSPGKTRLPLLSLKPHASVMQKSDASTSPGERRARDPVKVIAARSRPGPGGSDVLQNRESMFIKGCWL